MKRIPAILLVSSGLFIGFLCGTLVTTAYSDQQKIDFDRPVARVGDTVITRGQLAERTILSCGKELLSRDMQAQALINEAARRAHVTATDDEVSLEITNMLTYAHNAPAAPKYRSIPRAVWSDYARSVVLAQRMMGIANVNEEEARKYYSQNPSGFIRPAAVKLIVMSADSRTRANEILKRLQAGEDPQKLGALYNTDPALKAAGGEMNWVTRNVLGPEGDDKIFGDNLKPGQWTDVIKYDYIDKDKLNNGDPDPRTLVYSVFYVKEVQPEYKPKFEEVKAAAIYAARMMKMKETMPKWLHTIAADIGKDWQSSENLFDPNSGLHTEAIDPNIYDKQGLNALPNM